MRLGFAKETDWEYIGSLLAREDSKKQTTFFRAFIAECQSWGTHFQVEQQLARINSDLTSDERDVLKMLSYNEG